MNENDENGEKHHLSDIIKKALSTGLGAALVTEETIRGILSEVTQKDGLSNLVENAKNTRNEFIKTVKKEISGYLNHIDLEKEIDRVLEKYDIKVDAKVSFQRKEDVEDSE